MILNDDLITENVLNKLKKHQEKLYTCQGTDRWYIYQEAVLENDCSIKFQYSDDGEIHNILLTSENKEKLDILNITSENNFYNECLEIANYLFGGIISQQIRYI